MHTFANEKQEVLRDPTRPLYAVAHKAAEAKLNLQALITRKGTREALVNGKRVRVGSHINGVVIVEIGEKSVSYRKGDGVFRLYLRDSVIVKAGKP